MNRAILMGRLTRDPEVRWSRGERAGEFAEKHFRQGQRVLISGRIQTGSYVNRDGQKVYTTEVIVEEQEFADSRGHSAPSERPAQGTDIGDGFMSIPEGIEDEGLPFT